MKDYCTQNNGDCATCSLSNYGRDCMNQPIAEERFERGGGCETEDKSEQK